MNFSKIEIGGFEPAFRGMRNPKESYYLSDSRVKPPYTQNDFIIGERDLKLAQSLIKAGTSHRKFLRQITVWVDIEGPLYWWKEFDTYTVGVVRNSTSTMHTLSNSPITLDKIELTDWDNQIVPEEDALMLINFYENLRENFLLTGNKAYWKELIRWLPSGWKQKRTVNLNYESLRTIYHQRKGHKLSEWQEFRDWVETLPYAKELIII